MKSAQTNRYVVAAILALLAMPAVFLFGLVLGSGFKSTSEGASAFALWVSAGSTLAIAVLTFVLAKETWQLRLFQFEQLATLRKASIRPQVDVYLSRSAANFNIMNVIVENAGVGIARNIEFQFRGSRHGNLTPAEQSVVERLHKMAMFRSGIHSLSPQRSKRSFLFMVQEIYGEFTDDFFNICLTVETKCEDSEGDAHESLSVWDFGDLEGTSEVGYGDPAEKAAKHLEKISDSLQKLGRDSFTSRFAVNVYTNRDREKELAAWEKDLAIWKERHGKDDS